MSDPSSAKTGKRAEPELQFFESADTDRMAQMLMVMAAELHVLRDRVRCLEFILTQQGTLAPAQLDQFAPDAGQAQVLQQDREAFVAHLFEVLDGRAKSTSGRGNPQVPVIQGHGA
jgi:hypothetical protein